MHPRRRGMPGSERWGRNHLAARNTFSGDFTGVFTWSRIVHARGSAARCLRRKSAAQVSAASPSSRIAANA
jgi:hypothetical protein